MRLTEVNNADHTVTITLVHDPKTNIVQHIEFSQVPSNVPPEPVTWAVRARHCLQNLLQTIAVGVSKKGT